MLDVVAVIVDRSNANLSAHKISLPLPGRTRSSCATTSVFSAEKVKYAQDILAVQARMNLMRKATSHFQRMNCVMAVTDSPTQNTRMRCPAVVLNRFTRVETAVAVGLNRFTCVERLIQ